MVIDTPFVAQNGRNSNPEACVSEQAYVVLPLDGSGAHYAGAIHWNHTKLEKKPNSALWFAQIQMLFIEFCRNHGSVRPLACHRTQSEAYMETVRLAALIDAKIARAEDFKKFSKMVICDSKINVRFNYDVSEMKRRPTLMNPPKKDKKEEEAEEEEEVLLEEAPPEEAVPEPAEEHGTDWIRTKFNVDLSNARLHEGIISTLRWRRYKKQQQQHKKRKIEEKEEKLADEWEPWNGEHELISKIQMTLTAMPRANSDPRNPENICALLLRFLYHDPQLNIGDFVSLVVNNSMERNRPKLGNTSRRAYNKSSDEQFPGYVSLFGSNHPVSSSTTMQTFFQVALEYDEKLSLYNDRNRLYQSMNLSHRNDAFYPNQILNWRNASRLLQACGCEHTLEIDWYDEQTHTATFPAEFMTFKYVSDGVFWYNRRYVGISEHLFPFVSQDQDFLAQLVGGADPRSLVDDDGNLINGVSPATVSSVMQEIQSMISSSWLVERSKVQDKRLIAYRTNNEFIHRYAEATMIHKKLMQMLPAHWRETWDDVQELRERYGADEDWMEHATIDLRERAREYMQYCALRKRTKEALMRIFKTLWVTEGNIDDLPIPDSIKAIQRWYRDNAGRFPNLTREYMMWDPDMGMFSNCILRLQRNYAKVATIVHPILCILAIGLFSCYYQGRGLGFNMLGHGWHATGKTKTTINTFNDYTSIPGSTMEYCTSTGASDTTHRHMYDLIILNDEVAAYKVNPVAAEKFQDLANKAKVKMVDNKIGHYVFKPVTLEDQTTVRWSELVTTDHFVTLVEVTNKEVSAVDALASRYYRFTMPLPKIPIHQLGAKVDENLKEPTRIFLRIGQYLMACGMKCATVGGILPEPDKEVWSALNSRVIDFLRDCKAMSDDVGQRALDIMWPLVRQFIYMWAVHCAFDMPGAPNYKKKFEVDMIKEIEPYLYCTLEIWWFGWTALASQWVDDNNCKFLRAVEEITGYSEVRDRIPEDRITNSPYCVFEHDYKNNVHFRLSPIEGSHDKQTRDADNHRGVNFTQVVIQGDVETVSRRISAISGLSPSDCRGIINVFKNYPIVPPGGVFKDVPYGHAREFHKRPAGGGRKKTDTDNTAIMPGIFKEVNPDGTQERTEADVPQEPEGSTVMVVEILPHAVCVVPGISDYFRSEIITKALLYASMNSQFPEGKLITGIPSEHSSMMLESKVFTREMIDEAVEQMDAFDAPEGEDTLPEWDGNLHNPIAVSRRNGITVNRRVGISGPDRSLFTDCPMVPVALGDSQWMQRAEASMDSMAPVRQVIFDLDYEAALRQHIFSGRGFEEPVLCPRYIKKRYIEACEAEKRKHTSDIDYPYEWVLDNLQNEAVWEASAPKKRLHEWSNTFVGKMDPSAHRSRKPEVQHRLERLKEAKQKRERQRKKNIAEEQQQQKKVKSSSRKRLRVEPTEIMQ